MVTKGVILCGGQGTRFLPVTKAVAKEMLPVVDTPVLQFIVREMVMSGIKKICIVISPEKQEIVRFFSPAPSLEATLSRKNDKHALSVLEGISGGAEISFEVQQSPGGMADALRCAKAFVGNDPFVLSTGDDLVEAEIPVTKQLVDAYEKSGRSVIGGQTVAADKIHMYGCASLGDSLFGSSRAHICKTLVEKPKSNPPSLFAALGRYVLKADIFNKIGRISPDGKGELQVTDALKLMCEEDAVCTYDFEGRRYDMGNKAGAIIAIIDYALRHDETKAEVAEYLKKLSNV